MHLVNTIRYSFVSFFEFSVCIIIFNDDTISGNTVSTTGVTMVEEAKMMENPWYFSMMQYLKNILQSLIYKLTAQPFSDTCLPHSHQFLFLYEDIFYRKLTFTSWWLNCLKIFVGFAHPATINLSWDLASNPSGIFGNIENSCYRNRNLYTGGVLFI